MIRDTGCCKLTKNLEFVDPKFDDIELKDPLDKVYVQYFDFVTGLKMY